MGGLFVFSSFEESAKIQDVYAKEIPRNDRNNRS